MHQDEGTRLFLGAQHLDVPHTLAELENVLAGRDRSDDGEASAAYQASSVSRC